MGRLQWITLGGAAALFLFLYFGLDTVPPEQRDRVSADQTELRAATSVDVLIKEAGPELTDAARLDLELLDRQLSESDSDSSRADLLRQIAGKWYQYGHPAISGYFATRVAEIEQTDEAWSIAGSTFAIGLQRAREEKVRQFCTAEAVACFERAISLRPEEVAHRLNLALVYTQSPPTDQPMKGILMLRTLNQEHPGNVPILNNLGRLAIQTGQHERAVERLEQALALEPENLNTICLLANAYEGAGKIERANRFADRCSGERN